MINKFAVKFGVCLALLWGLNGQITFAAEPAWISFHSTASVAGPDILLGDIADIECEDAERTAQLRLLKISNAAAPGGKIVLSERVLQLRLLTTGGSYEAVTWNMLPTVTVMTKANLVSGERQVELVKDFLDAKLQAAAERRLYNLEAVALPNDLFVPERQVTYEFKLPYGIKYGFPTNVSILVYVDGQLYKKTLVRLILHIYEPVLVANRMLSCKEVITAGDVRLESMDISGLGTNYFTDPNMVIGMVVKRLINSGTVLSAAALNKPIIMERSARIYIISSVGGVMVQTEGEALQAGREGDWIRVRNLQSNKIISGKVVNSNKVEVSAN